MFAKILLGLLCQSFVGGKLSETENPKSEARSSKQLPNARGVKARNASRFGHSRRLIIRVCFGFRYSDFEIAPLIRVIRVIRGLKLRLRLRRARQSTVRIS